MAKFASVCPPVPPAHANAEYLLPWIGLWGPYRSHNQGPFSNYLSNALTWENLANVLL